ncbi:hypothetical protein LCGC14_2485150, partial [marine sediment metagenome]
AVIAAEGSDVDKFLVSSSGVVKYRTGTQVLSDIGGYTLAGVLEDLNTLTPPASDGQFIVATGAGAFQYEATTVVRTSLGLGTGDSPQFTRLGIGVAAPASGLLSIQDTTVDVTIGYVGFYNDHRKTAGVTDYLDYFYGVQNYIVYNQSGGTIGTAGAFYNQFSLVDGDIGDVSNSKNLDGISNFVDLNGGKVYGDVFSFRNIIDQEAANEVTGNIYGNYIDIDADGTVGGSVYGIYLNENSNVDYGIYQNGTAQNLFGGTIKIKEAAAANTDTVAYGQFWVKDDAPCIPMFTNDDGIDTQLGVGGAITNLDGGVSDSSYAAVGLSPIDGGDAT